MLSNDQKVETIAQLIEAVKDYLGRQTEYYRLDATEKVVRLLTGATFAVLVLLILIAVLLFSSVALAFWLSHSIGLATAFLIVAGLHIMLFVVLFALRKPLIERPLVRRLARILLER